MFYKVFFIPISCMQHTSIVLTQMSSTHSSSTFFGHLMNLILERENFADDPLSTS